MKNKMAIVKRLRDTKIKVIGYLSNHKKAKEFRDDDEKLVARYWSDELSKQGVGVKNISAFEFLTYYATGKLTPADVIIRARRKAQEECENLRGLNWKPRHNDQEDVRSAVVNNQI